MTTKGKVEPLTGGELAELREGCLTAHEVEGWAQLDTSYDMMLHVLAVLEDYARKVEPLTGEEIGVKAISDLIDCALDGRLQAVLDERRTLRAQLDEAQREVERRDHRIGELLATIDLYDKREETGVAAFEAANARIERLSIMISELLTHSEGYAPASSVFFHARRMARDLLAALTAARYEG